MKRVSKTAKTVLIAVALLVGSAVMWSSMGSIAAVEQPEAQTLELQHLGHINARSVADLFPLRH